MKIIVDLEEATCPYSSLIYSPESKETEVRCFANDKQPMGLLSISDEVRTLDHIPKCDRSNCPKKLGDIVEIKAYCPKCKANKEHSVKKIIFFGKKINVELDCNHHMVIWGTAVIEE